MRPIQQIGFLRSSTTVSVALAYVVDGDCRLVSRKNYVYKSFALVCFATGSPSWEWRILLP